MENKKIFSDLHDLYNKLKKEYDNRGTFKLWTITGEKGVGVNVKFVRENSPSGIYIDNDVHLPWVAIECNWLKIATTENCPKPDDNLWWEYINIK
jgi:hypothetical protein